MSNQIKDVLAHQAASVSGVDIEQRMAGVKAQVRARRTRRNSGIAAGVAFALVSFGAMNGVTFGGGVQAASRPAQLAGHEVPGTTSSLGYGFRYAEGKQGEGKVTLKVKGASTARMLRFAADSGEVVVMGLDERPMVLKTADGFTRTWQLLSTQTTTVRATAVDGGPVGIAVYDYSKAAPGVSKGTTTYRQSIANGAELVAAKIGDKGESKVSVQLPRLNPTMSYQADCFEERGIDVWVTMTVNGQSMGGRSCSGEDTTDWDLGIGGGGFRNEMVINQPVTLEARLTDKDGEPVDSSTVRLSMAVYDISASDDSIVEFAGHAWKLSETLNAEPNAKTMTASIDSSSEPALVVAGSLSPSTSATVAQFVDGVERSSFSGGLSSTVVASGTAKSPMRLVYTGPTPAKLQMEIYRMVADN